MELKEMIRNKRGCFLWLPVLHMSDLEFGAILWIVASFLTILFPIIPLASLYEKFWDEATIVPRPANAACYAFLIFMGVCYTIGSYLFYRAVRTPTVAPISNWHHIHTDELHAMWWFFLGTLMSVPICAIYAFYNSDEGQYGLALALALVVSLGVELATFATYPLDDIDADHVEYLSPYVHSCCINSPFFKKHLGTDWLIVSWAFLFGSIFATICSFGLMVHYLEERDKRGIYDYVCGFVDCVIFTVGCMYVCAGSYISSKTRVENMVSDLNHLEEANHVIDASKMQLNPVDDYSNNNSSNNVLHMNRGTTANTEVRNVMNEVHALDVHDEFLAPGAGAPDDEVVDDIPAPSPARQVQTSLSTASETREFSL